MEHVITSVLPHSAAAIHGIRPGDTLLSINGEEIIDVIDYEAMTGKMRLHIALRHADGTEEVKNILKSREARLGLEFGDSMDCTPRTCHNKCVFCFIDQMPPNMRKTLYVKDDDWRLSLMMGNYVTLTNVDDVEFERILRRKVSPLYISVHTTNPELRQRMMNNRFAGNILERLNRLKDAGLRFHCQIVLCPGLNDGAELERTLTDLSALYPAAQSAALVPVGLTKYRGGLTPLRPYTQRQAQDVMRIAHRIQSEMLEKHGTRFVFPSDEMLLLAGEPLPDEDAYEGFPQIENGVGLLRQFESQLDTASRENTLSARPRAVRIACGKSVAPVMEKWMAAYAPHGVQVVVQPIINHFFGETVTVTGLLTGQDILMQCKDAPEDEILLCSSTLRSEGDLFLDDMPLDALNKALGGRLRIVENTGFALYRALLGAD